jgi:hypothetical protein
MLEQLGLIYREHVYCIDENLTIQELDLQNVWLKLAARDEAR